ncbi:MAG: PAS domain S-box protein [Candidatus Aminicenantales bacterium]
MKDAAKSRTQLIEELKKLRSHVSKLETSLANLERTKERLQASEEKIRNLIEILPIGIGLSTPGAEGRIVDVNSTLLKIFGYDSKEEFLKVPASAHYCDPKERERFSELRKKGPVRNYETRFKRKDGSVFWASVSSIPQKIDSRTLQFINVFEDITERKSAQERLLRQRNELKARSQIIGSILKSFDLDERLNTILDEVMKFLGVEMGAIHLATGNELMLRCWRGIPDRMREHISILPLEDVNYMPKKPQVFHERLDEQGKMFDFAKREKIQSLAILPIKIERSYLKKKEKKALRLGTIMLASRHYEVLSPEDIRALEAMAEQLALAIDHSASFHNASKRLTRLEVIREIDRAILSHISIKEILKILVSLVPKELGPDAVAVSLLNGEKSKTKVFTIRFPNGTIVEEESFSIADSLLHWYVTRQEPVVIYDISQDPRIQMHREYIRKNRLCSYLGVPLVVEKKTIGILHILTCVPKVFMAEDIEFFKTLGGQAAIALKSASLFEELRESEEKFHTIAAAANDAIVLTDIDGKISFWNKGAERIFGYTSREAIGRDYKSLIVPDRFKDSYEKGFARFKKLGKPPFTENTIERETLSKDGITIPIELSLSTIKLKDRWYVLEIIRDITERKYAEKIMRRLVTVVRDSNDAIIVQDLDGSIISWNRGAERMYGYSEEEIIGKNIAEIVPEENRAEADELITRILSGKLIKSLETKRLTKSGQILDVWLTISPLVDEHGNIVAISCTERDITERKKSTERFKEALVATVNALTSAVEARDPYTSGHQQRVTALACAMGEEMGLSQERIEGIRLAGLIHDVGKISIPTEILTKPAKLNEAEISIIRMHPRVGFDILKDIDFPWPVAQIVLQHHERMLGDGYPAGISGDEILPEARILAVADVVEAMYSHRPYRPSLGIEKALQEISKNRGILYDPQAVDACMELFLRKGYKFEKE